VAVANHRKYLGRSEVCSAATDQVSDLHVDGSGDAFAGNRRPRDDV